MLTGLSAENVVVPDASLLFEPPELQPAAARIVTSTATAIAARFMSPPR